MEHLCGGHAPHPLLPQLLYGGSDLVTERRVKIENFLTFKEMIFGYFWPSLGARYLVTPVTQGEGEKGVGAGVEGEGAGWLAALGRDRGQEHHTCQRNKVRPKF